MNEHADVVVIGMGVGGEAVAGSLAEAGLEVIRIDRQLVGGECPYWGCIPSKMAIRAADLLAEARRIPGGFRFTPSADHPGGDIEFAYTATVPAAAGGQATVPEDGTITATVRHDTSLVVTVDPDEPAEGDDITLRAAVTGPDGVDGDPSGTVEFFERKVTASQAHRMLRTGTLSIANPDGIRFLPGLARHAAEADQPAGERDLTRVA